MVAEVYTAFVAAWVAYLRCQFCMSASANEA